LTEKFSPDHELASSRGIKPAAEAGHHERSGQKVPHHPVGRRIEDVDDDQGCGNQKKIWSINAVTAFSSSQIDSNLSFHSRWQLSRASIQGRRTGLHFKLRK
jgi:hypothetical protein